MSNEPEVSPTATSQKLRAASHGKRLFALILDCAFAVLLVNTIKYLGYQENWDLTAYSSSWTRLIPIYLSIFLLLLIKDHKHGCSPGKFIFGIAVRRQDQLSESPSIGAGILRNIPLLILPLEGLFLFLDSHGRRLGDRWTRTVVIENPKAHRFIVRLMAANTIFFGYFFSALLIQPLVLNKTAAYQSAVSYIENSPEILQQLGSIQEFESPEMNIHVLENEGQAIVQINTVGKIQTLPVTVHLTLVVNPRRSWVLEDMVVGPEPD
ncbi:MAG: RDD family protein [SAR324 cluster bacterium]|nr:RDD family protein [SAR324 cluster bacterium]